MSKVIRISSKNKADLLKEFEDYLDSEIINGNVSFTKSINSDEKTTLVFTELAWLKMNALVQYCNQEIGWHGVARRTESGYEIDDILVYPQQVTTSTVTTEQTKYEMWLMSHDDEIFNNIRMQGHSHVNMGVSPSGVDSAHQEKIINQMTDDMFYIFIIINKRGDKFIKIYDIEKNTIFETKDVELTIKYDANGVMSLIEEAKDLVEEYQYVSSNRNYFSSPSAAGNYTTSQQTTYEKEDRSPTKSKKGKRKG